MPKKWKGRLEDICSADNAEFAYKEARRTTKNKKGYWVRYYAKEEHRKQLCDRIMQGRYRPKPCRVFSFYEPNSKKTRVIEAPHFETKLVEHMITAIYWQAILRFLHPHCCASVVNRGIEYIRKLAKRWSRLPKKQKKYYVKGDIKKFFPSIDKQIALNVYRRHIGDTRVIRLIDLLMPHDVGQPLGNTLVQSTANLTLTAFDYECQKFTKHYMRYMDDFVLMFSNKRKAQKFISYIKPWVKENIKLEIKTEGSCAIQIWQWEKKALDIAGYVTSYGGYQKIRRKTYLKIRNLLKLDSFSLHQAYSLVSLRGWVAHSSCSKLSDAVERKIQEKRLISIVSKGARKQCQELLKPTMIQ